MKREPFSAPGRLLIPTIKLVGRLNHRREPMSPGVGLFARKEATQNHNLAAYPGQPKGNALPQARDRKPSSSRLR